MAKARSAIVLRLVVAAGVPILGCGGGGAPVTDAHSDTSVLAFDAAAADAPAADAPLPPDAGVDVPPDAPPVPADVREVVLDAPIACTEASPCSAPLTCCNGVCVDVTKDHGNCGSCGQVCSASQFCDSMTCHEAVFANVCTNPNAAVIKDQYEADNAAATTMGKALETSCAPPVKVVERDQGAPDVLGPAGRPLGAGGITYLIGGGSFGQRSIDYLDRTGVTPIYITFDGKTAEFHARQTSEVVVSAPAGTLGDGHDYFFVQLAMEPQSGTLCMSVVGMLAGGTSAGAFWLASEVIPKRAMYTDAWYAVEWTDSGDKTPNAADTFKLIAHGR